MMTTRLVIVALVTVGLAGAPFAPRRRSTSTSGIMFRQCNLARMGCPEYRRRNPELIMGHPELLLELSSRRQWDRTIGRR